jgi:hypothetical protein
MPRNIASQVTFDDLLPGNMSCSIPICLPTWHREAQELWSLDVRSKVYIDLAAA